MHVFITYIIQKLYVKLYVDQMANVKFYLDNNNILLSYYVRTGDIVRLSLKEKIDPKHWDRKKYRVKYSYKGANKLNNLLDELEAFVKQTRIDYKIKGSIFNGHVLKKELQSRMYGKQEGLFFTYARDVFIPDKVGNVKDHTVQVYSISVSLINKYLPSIMFSSINRVSCLKLEKNMQDDGYSKNYINRVFKLFHNCIKNAYIDGIHDNKYYMSDGFVPGTEEVDNIYLTITDLDLLYNYLDTASDKERNAVIIFLRGCYAGQRYQTYRTLDKTMIYEMAGTQMISIKHGKTGNTVSIPLSDKMKSVMAMDTHAISRQKLSDYIKEVCRKVGIPTWQQVSTHTARRTFATNMVLAGVDVSKIMKITGHKTEQEFRKYVKIDGVQSAISVIDDVNKVFGAL